MSESTERGQVLSDITEFGESAQPLLLRAQNEICFLLDAGYEVVKTTTFVGNHYQLSARQRMALIRSSASSAAISARREKELSETLSGKRIYLDAFNCIITLEAALSKSTLLRGMDGCIRDLCGLHGTYRLIDKTEEALSLLAKKLSTLEVKEAVFYLDSPISNSGRLRAKILEMLSNQPFAVSAELVPNADALLWDKDCVVSSDSNILDRCKGWVNLVSQILDEFLKERRVFLLDGSSTV